MGEKAKLARRQRNWWQAEYREMAATVEDLVAREARALDERNFFRGRADDQLKVAVRERDSRIAANKMLTERTKERDEALQALRAMQDDRDGYSARLIQTVAQRDEAQRDARRYAQALDDIRGIDMGRLKAERDDLRFQVAKLTAALNTVRGDVEFARVEDKRTIENLRTVLDAAYRDRTATETNRTAALRRIGELNRNLEAARAARDKWRAMYVKARDDLAELREGTCWNCGYSPGTTQATRKACSVCGDPQCKDWRP